MFYVNLNSVHTSYMVKASTEHLAAVMLSTMRLGGCVMVCSINAEGEQFQHSA